MNTKKTIDEKNLCKYIEVVNLIERDREIVKKYLFHKTTYQNLAIEYDISKARVGQIMKKFIRKASYLKRKEMSEEKPEI